MVLVLRFPENHRTFGVIGLPVEADASLSVSIAAERKAKPPEKAESFFRSVLSSLLGEILYDHSYMLNVDD